MLSQHSKQRIISNIFSKVPFNILESLTRTNQIFPYYHVVSDFEILHIKHLYKFKNIKQFKEDIDFLLKRYTPIGLFDLLDGIKNKRTLPKNTFLLSFDDGFREIYDIIVPILLENGISATFFLNSDFIDNKRLFYKHKASILVDYLQNNGTSILAEDIKKIFQNRKIECSEVKAGLLSLIYLNRNVLDDVVELIGYDFDEYLLKNKPYLTSDQINKLLKQGFTIGAHSIDHPNYSSLTLQQQLFQTLESLKYITEKFNLNYRVFSFPFGDFKLPKELFFDLYGNGKLDISFGNSGFIKDKFSLNIERINFEKPLMPAKKILAYEFGRNIFKGIIGKNYLSRY